MHQSLPCFRAWHACLAGALLVAATGVASAQTAEQVLELQKAQQQRALAHQQRIEALDDRTRERLASYSREIAAGERLRDSNDELRRLIAARRLALQQADAERLNLEQLRLDLGPRMQRMVETLAGLEAADLPFLADERRLRLDSLRQDLAAARLPLTELMRRILQAYLIEAAYGYDVNVERGPLTGATGNATVDYLRFGRLAWYYLTLDGTTAGVWEADRRRWRILSAAATESVRTAIRIVSHEAPPALVTLPIPSQ